jgi:hypothetical protein
MTRPSYFSRLDHPKNIGWGVQIIELLVWSGSRDRKKAVEKLAGGFWARCNVDDGDSDGCPSHPSESRTAYRGYNVFSFCSDGVVARLTCSSFWFR